MRRHVVATIFELNSVKLISGMKNIFEVSGLRGTEQNRVHNIIVILDQNGSQHPCTMDGHQYFER